VTEYPYESPKVWSTIWANPLQFLSFGMARRARLLTDEPVNFTGEHACETPLSYIKPGALLVELS
jgi:hypothetical protein